MPATTIRLQQSNDELISDDVKEIISYRPHWIIRKGNILFFGILLSLLAITWVIKVSGYCSWLRPPGCVECSKTGCI